MSDLRPAFTNAEVDGLRRLLAKDDAEGQRIAELETQLAEAKEECAKRQRLLMYAHDYITGNNRRDPVETEAWSDEVSELIPESDEDGRSYQRNLDVPWTAI